MSPIRAYIFFICLLANVAAFAQTQPNTKTQPQQNTKTEQGTPRSSGLDTLLANGDLAPNLDTLSFTYSKDSIDAPVEYNAQDSMVYDIPNQKVYLYGKAYVKQKDLELRAARIIVDNKTNIVVAEGILKPDGTYTERPDFKQGTEKLTADRMKYNFKTKQGKVYGTKAQQGDGFIQSGEAKFVSKDPAANRISDEFLNKNALYTTCDDPHPHFGILSTQQKIIPNKLIVLGPSNLVIGDVPTPLWLPFGFFPISKGRHGGLLIPNDYETSVRLGFGIKGIGWYFPISKHIDLSVRADIYTRGTWRANIGANYATRYKYTGRVNITTSDTRFAQKDDPDFSSARDFNIAWQHSQAQGAHPSQTFSANVNFGTSSFFQNTTTLAQNRLQNNLNSNINYSKRFANGMNLNASFSHSQNVQNRSMNITLPQVNLTVPQQFPFKRKISTGKEMWIERLGFGYSSSLRNTLVTFDTTLFKGDFARLRNQVQSGMTHSLQASMPVNVLKYFNVSPNFSYTENWYFNEIKKDFDPTLIIKSTTGSDNITRRDTTFGVVNDRVDYRFNSARQFSTGVSVGTTLYGTAQFGKKSRFRALRHMVVPNLNYQYSPQNLNLQFIDSVQTSSNPRTSRLRAAYNRLSNSPYGTLSNGKTSAIGFGFSSQVEAKVAKMQGDSTLSIKKMMLLNQFSLSGNYNMAADSFRLSNINVLASTTLFKFVNVSASAIFDPYHTEFRNGTARRTREFQWDAVRRPVNFSSGFLTLSTNFTGGQLREIFSPSADKTVTGTPNSSNNNNNNNNNNNKQGAQPEFITSAGISYNLQLQPTFTAKGQDSLKVLQDINVYGSLNLTKNWSLTIGRIGYDFVAKQLTYPDLTMHRNLHCWDMGVSWQPFFQTYTFFLRVTPGKSLDFLKVPYNKNQFEPRF